MEKGTPAAEQAYAESVADAFSEAASIGQADIVVGIPFQNEVDTIGHVYETVAQGLLEFFPGKRCVIVCVGAPEGDEALNVVQELPQRQTITRIAFLMKGEGMSGGVWRLRALMEVAERLYADVALFEADLRSRRVGTEIEGLAPEWVRRLLFPLRKEGMDLVVPLFNSHYLDAPASTHLVCPLLASVFNVRLGGLPGCMMGISSKLLGVYLANLNIWTHQVGQYGIDSRLVATAIVNEARICQTNLGIRLRTTHLDKERMWRQQTKAIFELISANSDWWQQKGNLIHTPAVFGERKPHHSEEMEPDPFAIGRYRQGFNEFKGLYGEILSRKAMVYLRKLARSSVKDFRCPSDLWAEIVYDFLLCYCIEPRSTRENILDTFLPLCYAREAGFAQEHEILNEALIKSAHDEADHITTLVAQQAVEQQFEEFISRKPVFSARWREKEDTLKPLLPMVTYREFIPGVPLILPKELASPGGETVSTDGIYSTVLQRYHEEFDGFVRERLGISEKASSAEIAQSIEELMLQVEQDIDESLLPGDLSTIDGTRKFTESIFHLFPHSETFTLAPEVASWILERNPPPNLLIRFGVAKLVELEQTYTPNDILALSTLSEETEHTERVWAWIAGNARPEHFARLRLEPLVVSGEDFSALTVLREPSTLSRLAGRLVVTNLVAGEGGRFPKLRYFITITKHIVEAERFGEVWERFARERKEFGTKVINSLRGHWGGNPLSAHNIFENKVQRILIDRLRQMIGDLAMQGDRAPSRLTTNLRRITDCYHLASSLPDGKFIPCSAWTWASYSFKGGTGVPTPLSLHVERDWATRELLGELLKALGRSQNLMDRKTTELMGQGMESENLARLILPGWQAVREVLPEQLPRPAEPEAGNLERFSGNPILEAIPEHPWESRYVFNPGAIRLNSKVFILYRACGEDEISYLGLAVSSDGLHIEERLESPVFQPEDWCETKGCEDPRLTCVDGRIYMLYTAYSNVAAQIALASISVEDFLNCRWSMWRRHGLAFPGFDDKDATLFPQKFHGRYIMYHRIEPSIWISSSEYLDCPWPREDHRILLGPGAGMAWDGLKIGGGSQPIKTRYGWLLIYHGVDQSFVYRLGVLLVHLDDPGRLLYRSPNPILEPKESYELGEEGSYVPNVVFNCGAVPISDKEVLEDDDEVLVYYGAADTVIGVATAKVSSLIPEEIRRGRNRRTL
ncbi:glycosidase [Chloroflexota bacterium]